MGDALEALVAVGADVHGEAAVLVDEVADGGDVGADGLVEIFGEGFAIDVGAEVFGVADGAGGGGELFAERGGDVFATLVGEGTAGGSEAAVLEGGEMGLEEVFAEAFGAEGGGLGVTAERVVLQAEGEVGRAAEGEVELLADDPALGAGLAEDGEEDAGLTLLGVDGVRGVGKEEEREAEQVEDGIFGAGLVLIEPEMRGGEEPVGVREQAGGDGAVIDVVGARAGFDDDLAGEEEWVGGNEAGAAGGCRSGAHPSGRRTSAGDPVPGGVQADGAGDVVEAAGAGFEVVGAVGGGEVLVVLAAGEVDVAVEGELVGVFVVGDGVGAEEVVGVGDFDLGVVSGIAGEEVDAAVFGLGVGDPGDGVGRFFGWEWGGARDLRVTPASKLAGDPGEVRGGLLVRERREEVSHSTPVR